MSTDWVEVAQDDTLDRCTRVDIILDDLLVNLLGVAIRAHSLLDRSVLGYRQILGGRLTINGTAA
jgi:hypothetical protein